ncbi:unnamed protein product [Vicia faba]|uniref:Aldehyde dehydrogenase domain-containing protein n=1 Tax=Vicia faba TaxID=3906 RepID=A0AAV0ZQZ2_VICFA|nr:unnamed protein product [Vicia faba]
MEFSSSHVWLEGRTDIGRWRHFFLKTSEQTPLSALYATKIFHEAGLHSGVLNIVSGFGPTAGAALASHMDVDKIAFTGSTATGKIILELAAKRNLKAATLELGGKSPFIVCEDADVDQAVELAHFALFFDQGQCCCAGSRTFVHDRVYDEFVEKPKVRTLKRVAGDPFKAGVEQGPQILFVVEETAPSGNSEVPTSAVPNSVCEKIDFSNSEVCATNNHSDNLLFKQWNLGTIPLFSY